MYFVTSHPRDNEIQVGLINEEVDKVGHLSTRRLTYSMFKKHTGILLIKLKGAIEVNTLPKSPTTGKIS